MTGGRTPAPQSGGGIVAPSSDWRAATLASGGSLSGERAAIRTVMLLIDTSTSMADGLLDEARRGSLNFARECVRARSSIGLIGFASKPTLLTPVCRNPERIERALPAVAEGTTAMHLAIDMAIEHIPGPKHGNALCIVTDGEPDDELTALASASRAKALGIDVLTIGVAGADHAFLARLATKSHMAIKSSPVRLAKDMGEIVLRLPQR